MAESDAGRSTVMRAPNELEASGFITRQPQFHDSGARRSSRYYLNHPLAPHCSPRPNPGSPRPDSTRAPSQRGTGPVSERHPTAVPNWDLLNPPSEPPTQPPADATSVLRAMPQPWRVGGRMPETSYLPLRLLWRQAGRPRTSQPIFREAPAASETRCDSLLLLADLSDAPAESRPTVAWCGECEDERSRTITVTLPDGTEAAGFCPRCSPQAQRQVRKSSIYSYDETEVNQIGGQRV